MLSNSYMRTDGCTFRPSGLSDSNRRSADFPWSLNDNSVVMAEISVRVMDGNIHRFILFGTCFRSLFALEEIAWTDLWDLHIDFDD
jgi:hypothetical protein